MSLQNSIQWIYSTEISSTLRDALWVIPTVQSIHIIAIAVLIGSALIVDLRKLGLMASDQSASLVISRYIPRMWGAMSVLLLTGLMMIVAEPERTITNTIFIYKMLLVGTAFIFTMIFSRPFLDPEFTLNDVAWGRFVKPIAWLSLAIWVAIIFCGRWIAYAE